jgi:hypothetical protein
LYCPDFAIYGYREPTLKTAAAAPGGAPKKAEQEASHAGDR